MKYWFIFLFPLFGIESFSQSVPGERESAQRIAYEPISQQEPADSIKATRRFLFTSITKTNRLKNAEVVQLFVDSPRALENFKWANRLKVVGPILSLSGLVLGYVGLKGTDETATVGGIKTASNRNPADVQVHYTDRSLAKTLGGVGLFVGGMCLIELANGLTGKSVVLYNAKAVSTIKTVNAGLTAGGRLGLEIHF